MLTVFFFPTTYSRYHTGSMAFCRFPYLFIFRRVVPLGSNLGYNPFAFVWFLYAYNMQPEVLFQTQAERCAA